MDYNNCQTQWVIKKHSHNPPRWCIKRCEVCVPNSKINCAAHELGRRFKIDAQRDMFNFNFRIYIRIYGNIDTSYTLPHVYVCVCLWMQLCMWKCVWIKIDMCEHDSYLTSLYYDELVDSYPSYIMFYWKLFVTL